MRRIVMLSGAPGVGKTTIARPLARALGLPLFAKDSIKERMYDVLAATGPAAGPGQGPNQGPDPLAPVDPAWSRSLGAASMELLWLLAADAPGCVLEANFWNGNERQDSALRALSQDSTIVEVYLTAPLEEIIRRFRARRDTGLRHSVHPDQEFTPDHWERNFSKPIGIGQVVEVDATTPVDVERLAATVRTLLG